MNTNKYWQVFNLKYLDGNMFKFHVDDNKPKGSLLFG